MQALALNLAACAGTVSDVLQPSEVGWFTERFQLAAVKRYGRLQAACTEQIYSGAPQFLTTCQDLCSAPLSRHLVVAVESDRNEGVFGCVCS
jgi:hypothetical protein